ncbi:hypothetical protein BJ546DRAFT_1053486 [Cryomyces antarcticus]
MTTSIEDKIHMKSFISFTSPRQSGRRRLLVFFITGNPGLIEYYRTFLTHLYAIVSRSTSLQGVDLHVFGQSLGGFDTHQHEDAAHEDELPLGLEAQIQRVHHMLLDAVQSMRVSDGNSPVKVVLVGHSVGAYILLEILQRQQESRRQDKLQTQYVEIVGGICLFPTVTHIAQSRSGTKFGFFFTIPHVAFLAASLVKALTFWIPPQLLTALVSLVTQFPHGAAATTTAFIKSKWGIRQALHMAKDEIATITEDRWDEGLWGATVASSSPKTKLFFYFGENDHWVGDRTRDELIAARAYQTTRGDEWRPKMEIDQNGIPHGFCIKHSVPIAEKVKEYIVEILRVEQVMH